VVLNSPIINETQVIIFILVVISFPCFTQSSEDSKLDSLKSILASQKDDSTKVNTLIDIGTSYLAVDINEELNYGNRAR